MDLVNSCDLVRLQEFPQDEEMVFWVRDQKYANGVYICEFYKSLSIESLFLKHVEVEQMTNKWNNLLCY